MGYYIRFPHGYISSSVFEMIETHKQKIKHVSVSTDDGGGFDYIGVHFESESKGLTDYFLRKLGAKLIDKNNKVYEVSR